MVTTVLFLVVFWAMQVTAALVFKHGSSLPAHWLPSFILGNLILAPSLWFMMKLYGRMNPNIAIAWAGGGAFLLTQLVVALVFHSRLSLAQWIGLAAITAGMTLASNCGGK